MPAPTATLLPVHSSIVLVLGLGLILNLDDIKALSRTAIAWIVVMGIIGYPVARLLQITAISVVGAARAVPMAGIQPIIAFTLGVTHLGGRPNLLVTLGTPIIVAGLFLVVMPRRGSNAGDRLMNVRRLGYVLALGAAAIFASRDVISRHVVSEIADPLAAAGLALAIGGGILIVLLHEKVASSFQNPAQVLHLDLRLVRSVPRYGSGLPVSGVEPGTRNCGEPDLCLQSDNHTGNGAPLLETPGGY